MWHYSWSGWFYDGSASEAPEATVGTSNSLTDDDE